MRLLPPATWVGTLLQNGDTWQPDAITLSFLATTIVCGILATRRGSRWWIAIPIVAALWTCSVVFQMIVRAWRWSRSVWVIRRIAE